MSKPVLLLVDDEERILRSLQMLFFSTYQVRITTDPHEAIRILSHETVHVIISDQRMPIMQGAELLGIARDVSPNTMRILLTGYSDMEASIASVNEGEIFRYLLKPWMSDDVKQVVKEAADIAAHSFSALSLDADSSEIRVRLPSLKVLVMDDDESTAQSVREIVQPRAEVIWASSVGQAMQILGEQDIAIVVADLSLGGQDISYVLKTVKQFNPQTLSMVMTQFSDSSRLIDLINQAQITRYLPKPIGKHMLARNLHFLLERFCTLYSMPMLQKRQSVAPISDPAEKQLSGGFLKMLGRLRESRV